VKADSEKVIAGRNLLHVKAEVGVQEGGRLLPGPNDQFSRDILGDIAIFKNSKLNPEPPFPWGNRA